MRGAAHIGGALLFSLWGLGCSQERVDLAGLGAGGSAARRGSVTVPAAAGTTARLPAPSTPSFITLTPTAPPPPPQLPAAYAGLVSRTEVTPPIGGGTLAVAADGSIAVAADPDRDAIHIVDLAQATQRSLQLPAASEPGRVVLDRAGRAHVVLRNTGQLARIEIATATSTLSPPLCEHARGLAFDAAADTLHLACADGALLTLDPRTYAVRAQQLLGRDLRDVVLGAHGERFVSRYRSAELLHLDAQGNLLDRARPLSLPRPVITAAPTTSLGAVSTSATLAYRCVSAPDGELWMVHQRAQDDELDQTSYTGALGCGPITQPSLTRFDAQGHPRDSLQVHLPASLAVDLAVSGDGQWLALAAPSGFVRQAATARLQRTDTLTAQGSIASQAPTQQELPDFQKTYCSPPEMVELALDAQAVAVAFDAQGRLYIQNRVPARLDIVQPTFDPGTNAASARLQSSIALADDVVRDLGHELFHGATGSGGLSCASCHGEGQDDGHVWRFKGTGARRTLSLRGGLLETLPLHGRGEFASFDALLSDQGARMGAAPLPPMPVRALAQWLEKLPALRVKAPELAAAMRGKELFESAALGCATCHSGPALTNNQNVDVGTGAAFQVPSLRGLALRGPYMHDGCAQGLKDVFEPSCGGNEHHARVVQLSAEQSRDLLVYVESL